LADLSAIAGMSSTVASSLEMERCDLLAPPEAARNDASASASRLDRALLPSIIAQLGRNRSGGSARRAPRSPGRCGLRHVRFMAG